MRTLAEKNYYFRSYLYNRLVQLHEKNNHSRYWKRTWKQVILKMVDKPVHTTLHGYSAVVNCGFSYPLVARMHKHFNNPLVQLAHQVYKQKGVPITIVDVGAAIGDTVFLLNANLPNAFKKILCVDGDAEFFSYLEHNMKQFDFVEFSNTLLSDSVQEEKSLVRTHAGTASAQGNSSMVSTTLDELVVHKNISSIDLLKIDTDGFDGKVLSGASTILKVQQPPVIFEWHPILLQQTGNKIDGPFKILFEAGYQTFIFFTKFGSFSHYMFSFAEEEINKLATICLNGKHISDWHYDVIALPPSSLDIIELAECSFAKNKTSAY